MMNADEKHSASLSLPEVKASATAIAAELKGMKDLTPEMRAKLIDVRSRLFQLGVYDPVLSRLDSATVPRATLEQVAGQLAKVASSL